MAADLERIGDLAKNIAKRAWWPSSRAQPKPLMPGHRAYGRAGARPGSRRCSTPIIERDADRALKPSGAGDEKIDAMYNSLFRELLTYMMEDPRNITACTHLLFGAKNLERIGDHATNIAETVYYVVTGSAITISARKATPRARRRSR